ncbi:MAG: potassium transporter TrkG [Candidatus Dependentiae bacterium]|jgi:trk system potassium uptake protein TrkH
MSTFSPGRTLLLSLLGITLCGVVLLSLPFAQVVPVSFFDTLFTTISTVCVTGLQTVPLASFSFFGHCVILVLMQIGGLGLMTFSFFLASLFTNMRMTSKLIAGQLFEFDSWSKIRSFLNLIIVVTLGLESIGACILYQTFKTVMPSGQAWFYAIFHSVSAFCNAGISLFSDGTMHAFSSSPGVLFPLAFLIIAGGIGFIVWYELAHSLRNTWAWLRNQACPLFSFSLHTRIVLSTSVMLVAFGTLCIWGIEHLHAMKDMSGPQGMLNSFFMAVSMRGAGFGIIDFSQVANATWLLLIGLMIIGASPGSTGSGIKTTTFALFCAAIGAISQNRDSIEMGGRTIPNDQMYKVIAIIAIALAWITIGTFTLLLLEPTIPFLHILIEVVSAFSTCGITIGITPALCISSKIMLMLSMVAGRIGMLALVLSLRSSKQKHLYRYPEERVLLG